MTCAKRHYDQAERVKHSLPVNTESAVRLFELCLSLLCRAMAPLAKAGMFLTTTRWQDTLRWFAWSGTLSRVHAYTDLAERLWCAKRQDLAGRVVQEQLRPLLEQVRLLGRKRISTGCPGIAPGI